MKITGTNNLYVGSFYRPTDVDDTEYLAHFHISFLRIPGAYVWLGADMEPDFYKSQVGVSLDVEASLV